MNRSRMSRRAVDALPILCALLGALAAGCKAHPGDARSVVLVTIDTLRADHLGIYGYDRPTSPNLDRLAAGATLYTRAMASSPWTVPSHASVFTGLDPSEHGAVSTLDADDVFNHRRLADAHTTLAEAFAAVGFVTAAFVANEAFLTSRTGLDQGFMVFQSRRKTGEELNQDVFEWLGTNADRPFFLFVNYMDNHRPYNTVDRPELADPPYDRDRSLDELIDVVMGSPDGTSPAALVARVIAQYDAGIRRSDSALGELIERLETLGIYDSTLIVVTSDHGEYFGEHRLVEHSKDVFQEALWVPLVIKRAWQRDGAVETRPIGSRDVAGLIAAEVSDDIARSLAEAFPLHPADSLPISENRYARSKDLRNPIWGHRFQRVRRAIFDWPLKYIDSSDGHDELYDLDRDPAEVLNLVDERAVDARRLRERLEARTRPDQTLRLDAGSGEISEAEREALRELGYAQ